MFKFNELRGLHLEITSRCQAACPMCARNYHSGLPNPLLIESDWTLDDYKKIVSPEVLHQIQYIGFCGNYGDPMVNNDLIEMCRYTKEVNANVSIRIYTNAGARKIEWWTELAETLNHNDRLIVAIDGLEDTHHLYRVNTTYERVIENATAFIKAGGKAEWAMLVFKHNEHQVEEANKRAKELGFENFTVKQSTRFTDSRIYEVYDKDKNVTHVLEPATGTTLNFIRQDQVKHFQQWVKQTEIDCHVKKLKEVYIDANKIIAPCCFIANSPYLFRSTHYNDAEHAAMKKPQEKIKQQYHLLVHSLGGYEKLNASKVNLKDIINSKPYQKVWDYYWNKNKLVMCAKTCGVTKPVHAAHDQYIKTVQL